MVIGRDEHVPRHVFFLVARHVPVEVRASDQQPDTDAEIASELFGEGDGEEASHVRYSLFGGTYEENYKRP